MFYRKKISELENRLEILGERIMKLDSDNAKLNESLFESNRKILLLKSDISTLNDKIKAIEETKKGKRKK